MKIFQNFYIWKRVPLQRRAVTIESDIFSFGNIIFLIPQNISFPVAYNMFRPFIDTILSQSHELKRMRNSEKTKTRMQSFVRNFPGAATQCMAGYMKPSIRANPNHFLLHVGTLNWIKRAVKSTIIWKICVTERTFFSLITAKKLKQVIWIVVGFI